MKELNSKENNSYEGKKVCMCRYGILCEKKNKKKEGDIVNYYTKQRRVIKTPSEDKIFHRHKQKKKISK